MIATQVTLLGVERAKKKTFAIEGKPDEGYTFQFDLDKKTSVHNFTVSLTSCSGNGGVETAVLSCDQGTFQTSVFF